MVKNLKGGKHKNLARKYNTEEKNFKVRFKVDAMEHYGFVEKILGFGHFDAQCDDGVLRRCMIPGKFKKRKRDNLVVVGGFILIGEYEFETGSKLKMKKGSLLETYSETDMRTIMDQTRGDDSMRSFFKDRKTDKIGGGGVGDEDVIFSEEAQASSTEAVGVVGVKKDLVGSHNEINIEDI